MPILIIHVLKPIHKPTINPPGPINPKEKSRLLHPHAAKHREAPTKGTHLGKLIPLLKSVQPTTARPIEEKIAGVKNSASGIVVLKLNLDRLDNHFVQLGNTLLLRAVVPVYVCDLVGGHEAPVLIEDAEDLLDVWGVKVNDNAEVDGFLKTTSKISVRYTESGRLLRD